MQSAQSQSSQVLRKSVVQSTFKQLYGLVQSSLVIRQPDRKQKTPTCKSYEDLKILANTKAAGLLIVDPATLVRGQLFEAEVRLEAEPIFQAGTVISAFLEILQEDPALFGVSDTDQLIQMSTIEPCARKASRRSRSRKGRGCGLRGGGHRRQRMLVHRSLLN